MPGPVQQLRELVDDLQARVTALEAEVRTRRIVVVDALGRPRIVLTAEPGVASVRVDADGGDPAIELYAVDAIGADGPEIGVALVVDGDVVGGLHHLVGGRGPRETTT